MCTATDVSNFLFFIVSFFKTSSINTHAHINYTQLCTCKQAHPQLIHMHTFYFFCTLRCLCWVTKRLTPSGFNFCEPSSSLWSRHRTAERGPWKYLRSAAWGGESEGKKLAFNKQDNGCHTPLLTPPLPAISLSHCSLFLTFSRYASPTLSDFFYKNCIHCLRMGWKT